MASSQASKSISESYNHYRLIMQLGLFGVITLIGPESTEVKTHFKHLFLTVDYSESQGRFDYSGVNEQNTRIT